MNQQVLLNLKASTHINLRNRLISKGINKDTAANIAHIFNFKLNFKEKSIVLKELSDD
jgi:hypothetical protein